LKRSLVLAVLSIALAAQAAIAQIKPPKGAAPAAAPAPAAVAEPAADPALADKQAAGRLAAAGWLVLLDRHDWGRAWETSATLFRNKVPLGTWMDTIPKIREPFGDVVERKPIESKYTTTLHGQPDGEYVSVVFRSKFADSELAEVVTTVRDTDGKWRVTGYVPPR
jgi:hypothetical protein